MVGGEIQLRKRSRRRGGPRADSRQSIASFKYWIIIPTRCIRGLKAIVSSTALSFEKEKAVMSVANHANQGWKKEYPVDPGEPSIRKQNRVNFNLRPFTSINKHAMDRGEAVLEGTHQKFSP